MVSLPALLAEAPHIPYKLQLSLESCDFTPPPHTHTHPNPLDTRTHTHTPQHHFKLACPSSDMGGEVWMEIRAGGLETFGRCVVSCDFYLGGWR